MLSDGGGILEMVKLIYTLCALTSLTCAWLLLRSFLHNRYRLLLWSGLCFVGFSINTILVILDRLIFPTFDMLAWRLAAAPVGVLLLLFGLIWEGE
jgi:hypothetical protein